MHPDSLRWKRCGTSWNTEPLPMPSAAITTTNSMSATGSVAGPMLIIASTSAATM
jgi:hypothetical protein